MREAAYALAWPVAWLCWTLVVGQVDGWVPYPFLDAGEEGWGAVGIACASGSPFSSSRSSRSTRGSTGGCAPSPSLVSEEWNSDTSATAD